jgi:hypothetical protein
VAREPPAFLSKLEKIVVGPVSLSHPPEQRGDGIQQRIDRKLIAERRAKGVGHLSGLPTIQPVGSNPTATLTMELTGPARRLTEEFEGR